MGERDNAKHSVKLRRGRVGTLATELSRRASSDYLKGQVKEMAREKRIEMQERFSGSPWSYALWGGAIGALVGKIAQNMQGRNQSNPGIGDRRWGQYGRPGHYDTAWRYGEEDDVRRSMDEEQGDGRAAELKQKASDVASDVKERVSETKDRVMEKAEEYRESARSAVEKATEATRQGAVELRHSISDQPGIWALGAMAAGAVFGLFAPLSERERRVLGPAKEEAKKKVETAAENAKAFARGVKEELASEEGQQPRTQTEATAPSDRAAPNALGDYAH